MAISRAFNGIGLAIVIPAIQSLIADSTIDSNRGVAFGWLHLTGNLGSIIGSLFAVLLASTSIFGISGWRIAFHLVALISVIVGILVRIYANDPHFPKDNKITTSYQTPNQSFYSEMKDLITEAKTVIKVPSFQIIVAQGAFGSFRGSSLSFFTLWLELIGFSHGTTAIIWTVFIISNSFGGLFGGWFGDFLSQRLPNTGRIMLAQISAGSTIPLAAILLLLLPNDPSTPFVHGLVLVILGLITFWCAPATNDPIFAEIVPEKSRTAIYALDRSFESTLASFAPPIVGILAQHVYGYKPIPKGSSNSVETDRENAASLAKALYSTIAIPIAICVFIYSFLYFTYPRDKERATMVALVESEMEQLKVEHDTGEEYYETHDNDEKVLLSR